MRTLHILKSEPDQNTQTLMDILCQDQDFTVLRLYEDPADYEQLIDLIFEHDRTISWW